MAIQQPVSTDKLNVPDHSLLHRIIASDNAAPVQSLIVDADGTTHTAKGRIVNITTVTGTYIALATDDTIVCNKPTDFTVTLPSAIAIGQVYNIKNIGAGNVTIAGNGGTDTIDTETTQTLEQWDSITLQCRANYKWIIL